MFLKRFTLQDLLCNMNSPPESKQSYKNFTQKKFICNSIPFSTIPQLYSATPIHLYQIKI